MKKGGVNSLSVGDFCRTSKKSKFKGLHVGLDMDGYYVYHGIHESDRYPSPHSIPESDIDSINAKRISESSS